jgi:hypothetical protein
MRMPEGHDQLPLKHGRLATIHGKPYRLVVRGPFAMDEEPGPLVVVNDGEKRSPANRREAGRFN